MPISSSGSCSLGTIQTEFGGTNPIRLSEYNRGGGLVANHGQNSNIPTTDTNIRVSNFRPSQKNYTTTLTAGSYTQSTSPSIIQNGYNTITNVYGSISGTSQIGLSKSSTSSGSFLGLWSRSTFRPKEGDTLYDLTFILSGDTTASTWYSITAGSIGTVLRTAFTATYNGTNTLYQIINDTVAWNVTSGTFTFRIASGD